MRNSNKVDFRVWPSKNRSPSEEDISGWNNTDVLMDKLQQILDDVECHGTFASSRTYQKYVNPGLDIKELGTVVLPLSDRDAQTIASVCKRSSTPSPTAGDETICKTCELDARSFECQNPAWQSYLEYVLEQAVQDLGVQGEVSTQPYKLLLSKEDVSIKTHCDAGKIPEAFGTLVISLPSNHTGGEVLLSHGTQSFTRKTAPTSAFDISVSAWYLDVQDQIQPITSGYRFDLVFSLVQPNTTHLATAAELDSCFDEVQDALQEWRSEHQHVDYLLYPLKHKYPSSGLSLNDLKGNGFYWFLAELTVEEGDEVDRYDYYGRNPRKAKSEGNTRSVDHVVTPAGISISLDLPNVPLDRVLVSTKELYSNRDHDMDSDDDPLEEPTTVYYRDNIAIIIPKAAVINYLPSRPESDGKSLLTFFHIIRNDPYCSVDYRCQTLSVLLQRSLDGVCYNDAQGYDHTAGRPNSYTAQGRLVEYLNIFEQVSDFCRMSGMEDIISVEILKSMQIEKRWQSKALIELIGRQVSIAVEQGKEVIWTSWLSVPLPTGVTYGYIREKTKMFEILKAFLPQSIVPSFNTWEQENINELVRAVCTFRIEDVEPLASLAPQIAPETYFEIVLPLVIRSHNTKALSQFLSVFWTKSIDPQIRDNMVKPTYQQVIQGCIASIQFRISDIVMEPSNPPTPAPRQKLVWEDILVLVPQCMQMDLRLEALQLLHACLPTLPDPGNVWWAQWRQLLNFVRRLISVLEETKDPELNSEASGFISCSLHTAGGFLAFSRPRPPVDWARPKADYISCACGPCRDVLGFLAIRSSQNGRFTAVEKVRRHIVTNFRWHHHYKFETEKQRSPQTLVVYKTTNEYDGKLKSWFTDVQEMWDMLNAMRSAYTAELLQGDVLEVAGLWNALGKANATQGVVLTPVRALQPLSSSVQNRIPVAPAANKPDRPAFIDLTEGLDD